MADLTIGYTEVQTILDAAYDALTGVPSRTSENTRTQTTTASPFARSFLLPTETTLQTLGTKGQSRLNGIYVIDLFYPKNSGVATSNADIDTLIKYFEPGLFLTDASDTVEIFNSYAQPALPDLDNFYHKQVYVEWWAYYNRNV